MFLCTVHIILDRLKPGYEDYLEEIEDDIKCKVESLSWLPNFYRLPPDVRIASSKSYREGKVIA